MHHTILAIFMSMATASVVAAAEPPQGVPTVQKSAYAQEYEKQCLGDIALAKAKQAALEKATGPRSVATVLQPLNAVWMVIDKSLNTASLMREVHPDQSVRAVADTCEQQLQQVVTEIGLSRPLYEAVSALDVSKEDEVTRRYVKNVLRDFRRAGVDKDEATRQKVRQLKDELVKVGQDFGKNMREDVRVMKLDSVKELDGLPGDFVEAHKTGPDGKISVSTDYPDYAPFMSYAKNDARRKELYVLFRKRGVPKNLEVLKTLLEKRYALAQLLGYKNWAEYITEDKMIKTAQAARSFIERINEVATPRAKQDYDELLARLKKDDPKATSVGDWQKLYIDELVKRDTYQVDSQTVREYFPYEAVKQGILDVTATMFGVSYRKLEVPVWHPSVEAFEMRDKDGASIGRFFLDMHPRDGKYKHAAAFPMQTGVAGGRLPEATLVCNFPGGDGTAGLMEHDHVETFFHEFGHLIHHMLSGKQRWVGVGGISTEWDFVEAPSQMLEEWAWDAATLKSFAKNGKGEAIPDALVKKMRAARDFGKGMWVKHQMFYAAVSLNYYDRDPKGVDTTALLKDLQKKYSPFPYVDDTYFQASFGHLDGYSAIYYTYMWSLVIAKDLFSVFEKKGLLDPEPASRYRKYVLEPGGSKDAAVLVKDFLQRDYTFDSFARWLNAKN
jgi:thimet oligopeptidase